MPTTFTLTIPSCINQTSRPSIASPFIIPSLHLPLSHHPRGALRIRELSPILAEVTSAHRCCQNRARTGKHVMQCAPLQCGPSPSPPVSRSLCPVHAVAVVPRSPVVPPFPTEYRAQLPSATECCHLRALHRWYSAAQCTPSSTTARPCGRPSGCCLPPACALQLAIRPSFTTVIRPTPQSLPAWPAVPGQLSACMTDARCEGDRVNRRRACKSVPSRRHCSCIAVATTRQGGERGELLRIIHQHGNRSAVCT